MGHEPELFNRPNIDGKKDVEVIMGKQMSKLDDNLKDFIADQKMFFVSTAGVDGRVNVSPKGMDSFRVINSKQVVWLNLTGSGNETAAHVLECNRLTLMFCAFEGHPLIVRIYGRPALSIPTIGNGETIILSFLLFRVLGKCFLWTLKWWPPPVAWEYLVMNSLRNEKAWLNGLRIKGPLGWRNIGMITINTVLTGNRRGEWSEFA